MTPNKDTKEDGDNDSVIIEQPYGYTDEMLYEGQSVEQKTIFNALMTYVQGSDKKFYLWGADALNRYVRIDAVSFKLAEWISCHDTKGTGEGTDEDQGVLPSVGVRRKMG